MTKAVVKLTDDPEYNKLVDTACALEHKTKNQILLFYWELGRVVKAATGGAVDGPRTVPQFLKHMHMAAPGKITLKEDSLYNALSVYTYLSKEELRELQDAGAALRNALALCNTNVTPAMRKAAIKRIASSELRPSDVESYVRQVRAQVTGNVDGSSESPPRADGTKRAATIQVTRLASRIESFAENLNQMTNSVDILFMSAPDKAAAEAVFKHVKTGVKAMDDLAKLLKATADAVVKVTGRHGYKM